MLKKIKTFLLREKAMFNLLRFFAIMLIITMLSRGIAGAVLPIVISTRAGSGTIEKSLSLLGEISWANTQKILFPAALVKTEILVKCGDSVKIGDNVFVADSQELDKRITREKALLVGIKAKQKALTANNDISSVAIQRAQNQLNEAYAAYDSAMAIGDTAAAATAQALAQNAELSRNEAIQSFHSLEQAAQITTAQNAAELQISRLDAEEKAELIDALLAIKANDYAVKSTIEGTVTDILVPELSVSLAQSGESILQINYLQDENSQPIKQGASIELAQGNQKFESKIQSISRDGANNIFKSVLPQNSGLLPGSVNCKIIISKTQGQLVVPLDAVHHDNTGDFVYVITAKATVLGEALTCQKRQISTIEANDSYANIGGAVTGSDNIILYTNRPLQNGATVRLRE